MALPTFAPPQAPTLGMPSTHTPRIVVTPFGDGYTQRMGDGLNIDLATCTPSWKYLSLADAASITAFFAAQAGWQAFLWQRPRDAQPRKWICKTWSEIDEQIDMVSITATFDEVADP